jgi:hypothetical protein
MNLIELAIVQIISSVKNERTFSTLSFMKSKLHNHLTWHLNIAICMFAHYFSTKETFPFHSVNTYWNDGDTVRVGVNA